MRYPRLRTNWDIRPEMHLEHSRRLFENYFHLLRRFVHLHMGWLPRVGSVDVKVLMGIHVYEDAVFLTVTAKRLRYLGSTPESLAAPGRELAAILDRLDSLDTWEEYVAAVYSVLKPALIDAWEQHFTESDPVLDEPSRRVLSDFLRVTSQHISGGMALVESLVGVPGPVSKRIHSATGGMRDLWFGAGLNPLESTPEGSVAQQPASRPQPAAPAREAFCYQAPEAEPIKIDAGTPVSEEAIRALLHQQLNRELVSAEICALLSHENPAWPLDFHRDMARWIWDEMRHVQALENLLGRVGETSWGEFPISLDGFRRIRALDTAGQLRRAGEVTGQDDFNELKKRARIEINGADVLPQVIDFFEADEESHEKLGLKWAEWLEKGGTAPRHGLPVQ